MTSCLQFYKRTLLNMRNKQMDSKSFWTTFRAFSSLTQRMQPASFSSAHGHPVSLFDRKLSLGHTKPFFWTLALPAPFCFKPWAKSILAPHHMRPYSSATLSSLSTRPWMKWILMRNRRLWNFDDKFALLAWFLLLNGAFLLFATTTYASCIFSMAELLDCQDLILQRLEKYLSYHTGLSVKIQGQVEHGWKDGKLIFRNISVNSNEPKDAPSSSPGTVYALVINQINVQLSILRFLEGKGLVKTCHVFGVDGSIDRRQLGERPIFKYPQRWGDFDMEDFLLKDASVFVKYPEGYRSYPLTIMSAHCTLLRKQWLLYDLLRAEHVIGTFDHCLFNLRTPSLPQCDSDGVSSVKKIDSMRHFRVDGVKIEHLNAHAKGPLSWITRGTVDINGILLLPSQSSSSPLSTLVLEQKAIERDRMPSIASTAADLSSLRMSLNNHMTQFHIDVKLKNLRTTAPFYSEELSLVNNTLIKPILAYVNDNRPCIPLSFHFGFPMSEFQGAWTLYDSGLTAELYQQVYLSFVRLVEAERRNVDTYKKIGWWSLSAMTRNFYAFYNGIFHARS